MSLTYSKTIPFAPFSEKQINYLMRTLTCEKNCAEGSIRSGKTILHCLSAYYYLETCEDKIHMASGSSVANAKTIIGDCNGFGLEHLFRGRCRWGKFKDNEALIIESKTGTKYLVFIGSKNSDSYTRVLGYSIGLWIATEINLHYDAEDSETSFIKVALGRQLAAKEPKLLWDLNPSSPNHPIYSKYIDKWRKDGSMNYEHFTLADNLSITEERRKSIMSMYDPTSVWYKRDILGMRCVAEGLIYELFANKAKEFALSKEQFEKIKNHIVMIECGVDYGGTKSAHTFVATAYILGFTDLIVLKSMRLDGSYNPDQLNNMFVNFCNEIYNKYGKSFYTNCDNAEPVLMNGMQNAVNENHCHTEIQPALKLGILQRIRAEIGMIAQGRIWYLEGETNSFVEAITNAVWNSKKPDERLDDGTSDIDTLDAFEYSFEKHIVELQQRKKSNVKELLNGLL